MTGRLSLTQGPHPFWWRTAFEQYSAIAVPGKLTTRQVWRVVSVDNQGSVCPDYITRGRFLGNALCILSGDET